MSEPCRRAHRPGCARWRAPGCRSSPRRTRPGRPTPSSSTTSSSASPSRPLRTTIEPGPSPDLADEGVLDGVLDQLGAHHRQRGRDVGADDAERALAPRPDRHPARADVGDQPGQPVGHLVEVDRLRRSSGSASRGRPRSRRPGVRPPRARPDPPARPIRRACSRSSAATVCRLFFTRWWISRMVASLVTSSRSRRRSSVTSRSSTSPPTCSPAGRSGIARRITRRARDRRARCRAAAARRARR